MTQHHVWSTYLKLFGTCWRARISEKCALTFIRIVVVHHAHETEWSSGASSFFISFEV